MFRWSKCCTWSKCCKLSKSLDDLNVVNYINVYMI
jgi:hypothetical protein